MMLEVNQTLYFDQKRMDFQPRGIGLSMKGGRIELKPGAHAHAVFLYIH